jgi:hypothetical protein
MKGTDSTWNHPLPLPPESLEEVRSRLGLSPREFEIALLLLAGHTEKGSAKALKSRRLTGGGLFSRGLFSPLPGRGGQGHRSANGLRPGRSKRSGGGEPWDEADGNQLGEDVCAVEKEHDPMAKHLRKGHTMARFLRVAAVTFALAALGQALRIGGVQSVEGANLSDGHCLKGTIHAMWSCAPRLDGQCWLHTPEGTYLWFDKCLAEQPFCVVMEE